MSNFSAPEFSTSLVAQGGLKTVKGGCGPHMLVTWTRENHTTNFGAVPVLLNSWYQSLQLHDQAAPAHPHLSFRRKPHTQFPPVKRESSSEPNNNDQLETSATWRLASKWSRCGQVWQPCRPGLVELSDASKIRVVWNWRQLLPREWPAFFLKFLAERHTVTFRNEVAGKTRTNY